MEIKYYDKDGNELIPGCFVEYLQDGLKTIGKFSHITPQGDAMIKKGDKPIWRKTNKIKVLKTKNNKSVPFDNTKSEAENIAAIRQQLNLVNVNELYNINQRFDYLEALVRMTASGILVSLIITGEGGIGKTYTVMEQIQNKHMVRPDDYYVIKGYSTTKGLYETLYEHNGKLIVFDDCDEVLLNDNSRNILKGALDSYEERLVSWVKSSASVGDCPDEFIFDGRIIFISNLHRSKMHQALLSRSTSIDLSMTTNEKIARMWNILPHINKDKDMVIKEKAMNLLENNQNSCSDLNFRTLSKIINILSSNEENSEEIARFMLLS